MAASVMANDGGYFSINIINICNGCQLVNEEKMTSIHLNGVVMCLWRISYQ